MKKSEIQIGKVYIAKVSNKLTEVKVDNIVEGRDAKFRAVTRYDLTNLITGRKVKFKSAAKFKKLKP